MKGGKWGILKKKNPSITPPDVTSGEKMGICSSTPTFQSEQGACSEKM